MQKYQPTRRRERGAHIIWSTARHNHELMHREHYNNIHSLLNAKRWLLLRALAVERKSFHLGNKIILANIRVRAREKGVFTGSNCTISIEIIKISPKAESALVWARAVWYSACITHTSSSTTAPLFKVIFRERALNIIYKVTCIIYTHKRTLINW